MSPFRIFLRVFALLATLTLTQAQAIPPREALVEEQAEQAEEPAEAETAPNLTGVYRVSGTNPSGSKYTGMLAGDLQFRRQGRARRRVGWWIGHRESYACGNGRRGRIAA